MYGSHCNEGTVFTVLPGSLFVFAKSVLSSSACFLLIPFLLLAPKGAAEHFTGSVASAP